MLAASCAVVEHVATRSGSAGASSDPASCPSTNGSRRSGFDRCELRDPLGHERPSNLQLGRDACCLHEPPGTTRAGSSRRQTSPPVPRSNEAVAAISRPVRRPSRSDELPALGSAPAARLQAIARLRFVGCGYRRRIGAYVHDSPRRPRGGVAGRSSGPPGGGRAGPSQPLGLSSAPSRLLAVARRRAAAGLAGCAVSWRKVGVLTSARGDGLPRLAFGCAAAAKFALLAAGWLHLLVALWARATPSSELDTAAAPEVPSPM